MDTAPQTHSILIIEDDETLRSLSVEKLTQEGFSVASSTDGAKGLAMALETHPDLIILDNRMPNMTGYDMLKTLRASGEWGAKVKVIFFTNVAPEDEAAAKDIEAIAPQRYLMKSEVSLDTLAQIVREQLGLVAQG